MARFKFHSYEQTTLVPVSFDRQILPETFEYTLSEVIDSLDMSLFESRYRNDETGAPAYDPRILLKITLYAYSKGVVFSRRIARLCEENVVFMALSANSHPHFTTIASFVSSMSEEMVGVFRHVLQICMSLDLVEGSMFAIDGVKLPSNASKEWSGTKADLRKKKQKLEEALRYMVEQHRVRDKDEDDEDSSDGDFSERLKRARAKIEKLDRWLSENNDKVSKRGRARQSNLTDNESAKMKTSHGVVQGYNGIAVVDSKHQVVMHAEAFGEGHDAGLLEPAVEGTKQTLEAVGVGADSIRGAKVLADTAFHSAQNLAYLEQQGIDGYVPDCNFRKRDPRFRSAPRHNHESAATQWGGAKFSRTDFVYVPAEDYFLCPQGNRLEYRNNADMKSGDVTYRKYMCSGKLCSACSLRQRCVTTKRQRARSVFRRSDGGEQYSDRMRAKIDSAHGRLMYSKRMGIVEPVYGNLRWAKGLSRFSLRGKAKVNGQYLLWCIVHNIEKVLNYGGLALA
jgi:transposase